MNQTSLYQVRGLVPSLRQAIWESFLHHPTARKEDFPKLVQHFIYHQGQTGLHSQAPWIQVTGTAKVAVWAICVTRKKQLFKIKSLSEQSEYKKIVIAVVIANP